MAGTGSLDGLGAWGSASLTPATGAGGIIQPGQRRLLPARHPGHRPKFSPDGPLLSPGDCRRTFSCLRHIAVVFRDVYGGLSVLYHLEYLSVARFKRHYVQFGGSISCLLALIMVLDFGRVTNLT
jgi:hypothetical protein